MSKYIPLALASLLVATAPALAQDRCADGKTIAEGVLTVATGNPAYYPWVIDDNPEGGEGFEAAVAYAVAERMGFAADEVVWTRTSFDQAIQPGAKDFDVNLQQYSITADRDKVVDFSAPYYAAAMAVVVRQGAVDGGLTPELGALKDLRWGVVGTTTALPVVMNLVAPDRDPLLYNDNVDVIEAMKADQIDAALFDLPTALYLAAVVLDDGVVLGQFPADRTEQPDLFGMLIAEGNPLKACVDQALEGLRDDGTLAAIEATWLQEATGIPLIE